MAGESGEAELTGFELRDRNSITASADDADDSEDLDDLPPPKRVLDQHRPFRWNCRGCLVPSRRECLEKELDELENARQGAYTDWRSRMYWHHVQTSQADCDKIAEAYRAFRATDAKAHRATACLHDCACPLK